MPARTSKQSSDREKACRFVLSALFQYGQEISRLLVDLFSPDLKESDTTPDFFGTVVAVGRKLKVAIDRVVAADGRLFAANTALDRERKLRARKTSRLARLIMGLRGACSSLFIDLPVQQLGFDARTAQDPVPLLIQADRVVENLESDEFQGEPLFPGVDFDPKKYAAQVRDGAGGLRGCLDNIAEMKRKADTALLEKRAITEEYDDLFLQGARAFETYCRMAGKTELADRVRPSESRPGRTVVPPDESDNAEELGADESVVEESAADESVA